MTEVKLQIQERKVKLNYERGDLKVQWELIADLDRAEEAGDRKYAGERSFKGELRKQTKREILDYYVV